MKLFKLTTIIVTLMLSFSCKNENLAEFKKSNFNNNRWYKTEKITLSFENTEKRKANIILNLGYIHGSQFAQIPLEVYITNPLHQIKKLPITLRLFDDNKNELGECMGDLCDITQALANNYSFDEIGEYKIQVLNTFSHEYIPNVNAVSITVK